MKRFLPFALVLSLLFSSCVPATPPPETTTTPTETPIPTATATATATETPTPNPKEQIFSQLKSEGISVDQARGKLSFNNVEVPKTSIDLNTGDLHIQVGDQSLVIIRDEILQRLSVKEGSIVVYDDKGIDSYDDPDMNNWTKVEWAFNPNVTEGKWAGWIERSLAISVDKEAPIIVGNSYDEYHRFVEVEKAFFQPYSEKAKWPVVVNPDYEALPEYPYPFGKFDVMENSGGDNPFRDGVNFAIVEANNETDENRIVKDVGIITEQVLNPNDRFDTQALHFASGNDSKVPLNDYYDTAGIPQNNEYFYRYGTMDKVGLLLPSYFIGYGGWYSGRNVPLGEYYMRFGFMDSSKKENGQMTAEVRNFITTHIISERLQKAWLAEDQRYYRYGK